MKIPGFEPVVKCFKRWSRKAYSVLLSFSGIVKIGVLCLSYVLVNRPDLIAQSDSSAAATDYEFEGVEITGRRSVTLSSSISRIIRVISKEEIEKSGLKDIPDILEYISNADIRQRGGMGVQADISMRGSSFDHVMILVNGVNLSDPQTGHLGMDLPIDPFAIERIELLEGPAARSLGPGAFLGAVNIITKKNANELKLEQSFGKFGLYRTQIASGFTTGPISNYLSAGRSSSDGYTHNTDHEIYNVYYRSFAEIKVTQIDFQAGYQNKKFGAGGFYSPVFPEQYEENSGWFGSLKVASGKDIKLSQQFYWRRRNDHFLLIRNDPSFYENFHLTDVYGSQFNITYPGKTLTGNAGIDLRSENILSNNIGYDIQEQIKVRGTDSIYYTRQYQRTNFSLFAEEIVAPGNWNITAGLMVNWNTGFHGKPSLFPGVEISYNIPKGYALFINFNRALHLPTFTDLFYRDPVNQGNLALEPNRIISLEGGLKFAGSFMNLQVAAFYNNGRDIVDWLWNNETNRFSPVNLDNYSVSGFSSNLTTDPGIWGLTGDWLSHISLSYMYLSVEKSAPSPVSKYYSLKHKFSAVIQQKLLPTLGMTWRISYQDRYGESIGYEAPEGYFAIPYKPYWLIDAVIKWEIRNLEIYSEASNILNTRYIDAGSVSQAGFWLKAGLIMSMDVRKRGNR